MIPQTIRNQIYHFKKLIWLRCNPLHQEYRALATGLPGKSLTIKEIILKINNKRIEKSTHFE